MRQIFNETIKRNEFTHEDCKKVTTKVIHMKRDVENVSNYLPICSLLALYKLFSTILYGRLYPVLDQKQAEDQAGFRKSYQTTDHLATYRLIEQECYEWGTKMWTATVDFTKAFDSITHKSQILQHRSRLHQPPEEDFQRPRGICTDGRREQHFRDPKRNQAR